MEKNQHEHVLWLAIGALALVAIAAQISRMNLSGREAFARETPEFEFHLPKVTLASHLESVPAANSHVKMQPHKIPAATRSSDLLVEAIIELESHGNPEMVGGAGERGLMQLMPTTWSDMSRRVYGEVMPFDQAFNPRINRALGTAYLDYLQEFLYRHQSAWRSDLRSLLLASYNFGPNAVAQAGFEIRKCPAAVRSYANRGAALHDAMLEEQAAKARPSLHVAQVLPFD